MMFTVLALMLFTAALAGQKNEMHTDYIVYVKITMGGTKPRINGERDNIYGPVDPI